MSGSERTLPPASVPRWMSVGIGAVLSVVVGFGLVGLALADASLFLPVLVVPLGAVAAIALFRCVRPRDFGTATGRLDALPAVGAIAVAAGNLVVNLVNGGQHVLIDRDPGAYLNTGRWLATHRSLVFDARVGPFASVAGLRYSSPAIYGNGSHMHFQFSHLLGVLLAEARWIGGDHLMLALTPILGAVAIVVFYALACRFVRPGLALVAAIALAGNVVQLHFSRDAYSEIVVQLVLLGSLWIVAQPGLSSARAVFAGVLLGTCVAARIDGPLYLAAVPVLFGIAAARRTSSADSSHDDITRDVVIRIAIGASVVAVLGIVDVGLRVPEYARHLGWRVVSEYVALIAVSAFAVWMGRRAAGWHGVLARHPRVPAVIGGVVSVGLFAMWFVRPHLQHPRGKPIMLLGHIQAAHHQVIDRGRRYFENSLRWHAWYLGPPALAAGIVGFGLMLKETIERGSVVKWMLVMCFGVAGGIYLWNASITPDQLWVMRRFVPIVIPGFLLFAVVVIERVAHRWRGAGFVAAAALGALLIAWPLSATLPVRDETAQPGELNAVIATCRALGPHAAVVVLPGKTQLYRQIPQALRGFCNVPVAIRERELSVAGLQTLARRWRASGRVLHVFADSPGRITALFPHAVARTVATSTNHHLLDQTLDRPPRLYVTYTDTFVVATVPLGSAARA